jgi:tetratricopeptide (TPR) repeat protein
MSPSERERGSRIAGLLLLAVTYLLPLVLFAGIEIALRVFGVAEEDPRRSRLAYQQLSVPILRPDVRPDGTPVWRVEDSRLPYQAIARDKPDDAFRVFVLGGSAAAGLGFSPNATFSRELERTLDLAYPQRRIEVVNLGVVALASAQVDLLVEDAIRHYSPDLLVVYSGNNEFLEIHARKYADAQASAWARAVEFVLDLRLTKILRRVAGRGPQAPSEAEKELSHEDLRLTQNAIIQSIEMRPEETDAVIARYERNIRNMVERARAADVPILLVTVASNWRWRGRNDLPEGWIEELLGSERTAESERTADALSRARDRIDRELAGASSRERAEWLYKRGLVAEALGDVAAARDAYRAAMNADPHQRRALDRMADGVRTVAAETGAPLVDSIDVLAAADPNGIVGFDVFYDYVHFTPLGNLLVAAEIFRIAGDSHLLPAASKLDSAGLAAHLAVRRSALADPAPDGLEVSEWLGFGFDPAFIRDRDLWKYDRLAAALDERLEADPADLTARIYRGNLHAFQLDGAAQAARDYRAALELAPGHPAAVRNLERLLGERTP